MTTNSRTRQPEQPTPANLPPPARKVSAVVIGLWRFVRRLWPHIHIWETTHTNQYQIPTVQRCRCGLTREIISHPHEPGEYAKYFTYWWRYSDGRYEKDERVFKHTIELDPPNIRSQP